MKIKFLIYTIFIGIILGCLYGQLVGVYNFEEKFLKYVEVGRLDNKNIGEVVLDLPKDSYLLKLKYPLRIDGLQELKINNVNVYPDLLSSKKRGDSFTGYWYVPANLIKGNRDSIKFLLARADVVDIEVILTNYRKKLSDNIYVLFSDSSNLPSNSNFFSNIFLTIFIIVLFFFFSIYFISKLFILDIDKLSISQIFSIMPILLFLGSIYAGLYFFSNYRVVIQREYFFSLVLYICFFTQGFLVWLMLWRNYKNPNKVKTASKLKGYEYKLFDRIALMPTHDKFMLLFMFLLFLCIIPLFFSLNEIAEVFSNIAYLFLVLGIIGKFIFILKKEKRRA